MEIHYWKRNELSIDELNQFNFKLIYHSNFNDFLKNCELLVLSLPYSNDLYHLINDETINYLPNGAKIVNVGRGKLINEDSLVKGLKNGKLSSVGLDVFENEPIINEELLNRWDVTLLPHLGSATLETYEGATKFGFENLKHVLIDGGNGFSAL